MRRRIRDYIWNILCVPIMPSKVAKQWEKNQKTIEELEKTIKKLKERRENNEIL